MKNFLVLITLLLATPASEQTRITVAYSQEKQARIGAIDFYGYAGLNIDNVRAALPIREGQTFPSVEALVALRPAVEEAVRRVTGRPPTEVAIVSPGVDVCLVYIGLSGDSMKSFPYNPAPQGMSQLPATAMDIYGQVDEAFLKALRKGAMGEDDSRGFALSRDDPELRAKQLAMHEYAAQHEDVIRDVLRSASDSNQRQIAAELLGYANQSSRQINDLVWASRDPDAGVRNNATRALTVLAGSAPKVARRIPTAGFIKMLNSANWTDRNKAGALLMELSKGRNPQLLTELRSRALQSLFEMAEWRLGGHGYFARVLLGRIAGIEETRLQELALANDQAQVIIKEVRRKR